MDDADVVRMDERDEYTIRTFVEDDRADVERLASEGLLVEPQPSAGEDSSIVNSLRLLGFEYTRTHEQRGRSMLEFYLNLYQEPQGTS